MTELQNENQKDEALWAIAKKRAEFKKSLFTYIVINIFLWTIWYFTDGRIPDLQEIEVNRIPWPAWASLGWGLGIALQYSRAYIFHNTNTVESEYQKLKNKS